MLLTDYSNKIRGLEEELKGENEDDLKYNMSEIESTIFKMEKSIKFYETGLENYFDEIPQDLDVALIGLKEKTILEKKDLQKSKELYSALKAKLEFLDEFLEWRKLKVEYDALCDEKKKLDIVGNKLEKNKQSLAGHIREQIDDFFNIDLINEIYKRIDPHPEYKHVDFKADLSGSKPQLNIFLNKEEKPMSPLLFLSTAQINILSLSIFLARALTAVDDHGNPMESIFIDDPIQSMDSINVLSVIDLIRTIIHQHKKQVILSTHDENWFELIKKKIPNGPFQSKFFEFETIGVVKESPA